MFPFSFFRCCFLLIYLLLLYFYFHVILITNLINDLEVRFFFTPTYFLQKKNKFAWPTHRTTNLVSLLTTKTAATRVEHDCMRS